MSGEHSAKPRTARLQGFLSALSSHAPERAQFRRLSAFLSAYIQHRPPPPVVVLRPALDPARLGDFLTAGQPPLERLRASGAMINPWEVAGVGRKEVRNSAVLATLWSPQHCGALGRAFLDAFCRRIHDPTGLLPTSEDLAGGYVVRTEHCAAGAVSERLDISIEGRSFVLGIEVKIDAAEGQEQLNRYIGSVRRWAKQRGGKRAAVIFLASYRPSEQDVLHATWRDVINAGRDCLRLCAGAATTHSFLLKTFVRHCNDFGG